MVVEVLMPLCPSFICRWIINLVVALIVAVPPALPSVGARQRSNDKVTCNINEYWAACIIVSVAMNETFHILCVIKQIELFCVNCKLIRTMGRYTSG